MEPVSPARDPMLEATLRQMADIALPPPVSMMPATWGWAVLGGVLLLICAFAMWIWLKRRADNRYRREALAAVAALEARIGNEDERHAVLAALPDILKRTALAAWPREQVAALNGKRWAAFLKAHDGRAGIDAESYGFFADGEYHLGKGIEDQETVRRQVAVTRHWIEGHDVRS